MSVVTVKAHLSCDECDARFIVELDEAAKCETVFAAIEEALRGGADGGSYYDDVIRCEKCTSVEVARYIAAHPKRISSICKSSRGCWVVVTYDETEYEIPLDVQPDFDREIADYPTATVAKMEAA